MNVKLRGSIYCIVRRVPRRFASVEERKTVWISLKTDSLSLAMEKAPSVWAKMLDSWEARLERRQSMADIAPGPFGQGLRISPVQVIWAFNIIDVEM